MGFRLLSLLAVLLSISLVQSSSGADAADNGAGAGTGRSSIAAEPAPPNPWGFNFDGGSLISSPPSTFCNYFNCIASFWNGVGYVVQCVDSTFSLSGGRTGVCSQHGGFSRNLYAPTGSPTPTPAPAPSSSPPPAATQCGVERWAVKTGTDPDAGLINLASTTPTSITSLTGLPAPSPIPVSTRVRPTETTVLSITATLTVYKREDDSDYHLVVSDGSGHTMITEIADPQCVGAGSPLLPGIRNARSEFDARLQATTSFKPANLTVTLTGVGFFDFNHGQTGVAPNAIELHPVLDISFGGVPPPTVCTSSTGPGIAPPATVPSGIDGFHASWYGQSGYQSLCAGAISSGIVAYYNSGSRGWVSGRLGEVAYLGTWNPQPGQDQPSVLGGDGTSGSPSTDWPRFNRVAIQPADYVAPGQVAWFQFTIQAPSVPGRYTLAIRPLIEGAQWMEDYGVFWVVTVLRPDGSAP